MTQHDFFTPDTRSCFICPNCGTFCCIDSEFKHGILPVKRQIVLRMFGCTMAHPNDETEKVVSIPRK